MSRKVSEARDSGMATSNAPMCCVMPPASPAATAVLRSASSSDVCTKIQRTRFFTYMPPCAALLGATR